MTAMWTLRSAAASPFVRKVRIAAAICGLADRIDVQVTDTSDAAGPLRRENPLGKIPSLVLDDGTVLYDSRVIAEFLDAEAGGGVIIPKGAERFRVLTLQALADGIMDASVLRVYEERWRTPEERGERWMDHQRGKVERGLAALEAAPPKLSGTPDIGEIAVACALGYQDLRFSGEWRKHYPKLVAWLDDFAAKVPSFEETKPS
jgi:glutathione S-transferase